MALIYKSRNIIMFVSHNAYRLLRNTSFKQDWAWGQSTKCGHSVEFRIGVGWITGKLFLYSGDGSSLWTWGWVREWVGVATINERKISTARMLGFSKISDAKTTNSNDSTSEAGDMLVIRIQEVGRKTRLREIKMLCSILDTLSFLGQEDIQVAQPHDAWGHAWCLGTNWSPWDSLKIQAGIVIRWMTKQVNVGSWTQVGSSSLLKDVLSCCKN